MNASSAKSEISADEQLQSDDDDDQPTIFKPPFIMGEWENQSEDKRVSIAILMPSGTCKRKKDHSVCVIDGGTTLQISIAWPRALTDLEYLHKHWLESQRTFLANNPRVIAFRSFLRRLRTSKDQPILSTCQIKLPFPVKEELAIIKRSTTYLGWKSNEVVLYITLEAPDANYEAEMDEEVKVVMA